MTKNQIQYVLSFSLTVDHLCEVAELRWSELPKFLFSLMSMTGLFGELSRCLYVSCIFSVACSRDQLEGDLTSEKYDTIRYDSRD